MQIVPIIPQQTTGVTESRDVKGVAAIKAAKPVQEHELPAVQNNAEQLFQIAREIEHQEKRIVTQQVDRRRLCRRIRHSSLLEELRSSIDRRRRKQRNSDLLEHIDEEA